MILKAIKSLLVISLFSIAAKADIDPLLKKTEIIKGITVILPSSFEIMSDDDIAQKYPTYKKPLAMYNSKDKSADFGVNFAVNKWNNRNMEVLRDMYKSTIMSVFNSVTFIQEGTITKINDRDFVLFEFVSELIDEKRIDEKIVTVRKYSYIAYTLYENKILIFNFTCPARDKNDWYKSASEMIRSLKITNKLKINDFTPKEAAGPQPKGNDIQMQLLKKMQNKNKKQ